MLNFTLRAFGLEPLKIVEALYVSDMYEVEAQVRSAFPQRSDCGSSREILDADPNAVRDKLLQVAAPYQVSA